MNFLGFTIFLCIFFFATAGTAQEFTGDREMQNFFKTLETQKYDKRAAPMGKNGPGTPVEVLASCHILDINKIDDINMDLNAHLYFRQTWNDTRLHPGQKTLMLSDNDEIWSPDLFFIEEREGSIHQVTFPNKFIRIKPNGEVTYSVKIGVTFRCPMDLRKFPHDIQECTLSAESYGFQRSHIELEWKGSAEGYEPVTVGEDINMLDFDLIEVTPTSRNISMTFGEYKTLQINLKFKRNFGFFATRLYVPFILLVLLSSFSMWIKAEERCLRLSLLLVILYLMVTISSEINNLTPPAPYTKASDVWIGVCESMVFAAFLEFIFVALIARKEDIDRQIKGEIIPVLDPESKEHNLSTDSLKSPLSRLINMFDARNGGKGKRNAWSCRIDRICRIVFIPLFILFNIIYWSVYC